VGEIGSASRKSHVVI